MTEAEARALLLSAGHDDLEQWIAAQPWRAVPGGWQVPALENWSFRVEVASADGLRITALPPDAPPAVWLVPAKAK